MLAQSIDARAVFLSQVHGSHMEDLSHASCDGTVADAAQSTEANVACTVMVADCLPVLFTNTTGTWVAAAHAGWRGLAGSSGHGVLDVVVERFCALAHEENGRGAIDIVAWLGPCIGPTAFEVGGEVRDIFVANDPAAESMFTPASGDKWLANLAGLARQRLLKRGVVAIYGNNGSEAWCTVNQPSRFFSYRRDGITGRFAASVWRR